jgi:hypothetical protein
MPTKGAIPFEHIQVFVGFADGIYRAEDGSGTPTNDVTRIGGSRGTQFPTPISWTIRNQTGHKIQFSLHRFERDSGGRCPVAGGDIFGCEFHSGVVDVDGLRVVDTALNPSADLRTYGYDLFVKGVDGGNPDGNIVDPELQIDM